MSDLVNTKIAEALAATGGQKHDAQKLLITWAVRDPNLLLGMTKPHLKAIAAGLIDHAQRTQPADKADTRSDKGSRTAIDDIVATAAMRVPLDKRKKSTLPPPKTTERQASAMRRLAAAFTKNKKN